MLYIREFEIVEDEGYFLAFPVDMPGGTQGASFQDALEMAAEWLWIKATSELEVGRELTQGTLGHKPERGGTITVVAVSATINDVDSVTASEAATRLGVSTARVAQLCAAGELVSWTVGATRMVSERSIELRLEENPQAGRPKKTHAAMQA